jgi:hypothetical protein
VCYDCFTLILVIMYAKFLYECVHLKLRVSSFCPVDQSVTEHMIIIAGTRKTGMKQKLLIIQEKLDLRNMVDAVKFSWHKIT